MADPSDSAPTQPCSLCLKGSVMQGEPQGEMKELGGIAYYITKGGEAKLNSEQGSKVIVYCMDFFGFGVPNPKLCADIYAEKTGHVVVVPDYFRGSYPPSELMEPYLIETPINHLPLWSRVWKHVRLVGAMLWYAGPMAVYKQRFSVTQPIVQRFCEGMRGKGATRLGVVGFCWGGLGLKVHVQEPDLFDAVVMCHPTGVSVDDFKAVKKPLLLVCAQEDPMIDRIKPRIVQVLAEKKKAGVPTEVKTYGGTVHGFACRPSQDKKVQESFEVATTDVTSWFKLYL